MSDASAGGTGPVSSTGDPYGTGDAGAEAGSGSGAPVVLVDEPAPGVRRITMNRPEKRNALFHPLRAAIFDALVEHDRDDEVRVTIIRGAGPSFSAGYDLGGGNGTSGLGRRGQNVVATAPSGCAARLWATLGSKLFARPMSL